MSYRRLFILYFFSVILITLVTTLQSGPGYMDADYYFAGGLRLAQGHGFSELILWNYLDDPSGFPHPSHGYWMPLASIVVSLGMWLSKRFTFEAGRTAFIILVGLVPPLTAMLSYSISQHKGGALIAGLLAVFPVFYLAYLGTTDTFGIYMLLALIWFSIVGRIDRFRRLEKKLAQDADLFNATSLTGMYFALGWVAGLMHLTRADGLIWLLLSGLTVVLVAKPGQAGGSIRGLIFGLVALLGGYLLVMGPWMYRNISVFGTPLSPGGGRALWLTEYNDLYAYPASQLTPQRWLASGLGPLLKTTLHAAYQNLQTAWIVQGEIFLAPLILLGIWRQRRDLRVLMGVLAWSVTLMVMTFVFPDIGWRGGFFHSGAALQPLFWALTPIGLSVFIDWGARVRGWNAQQAGMVFNAGLIVLVVILSGFLVWERVVGSQWSNPIWDRDLRHYRAVEKALQESGAADQDSVLVNNAPGYFVANGRAALSIPNGDEATLLKAAQDYSVKWVILEADHPTDLDEMYREPGDRPGLVYLTRFDNTDIYRVE